MKFVCTPNIPKRWLKREFALLQLLKMALKQDSAHFVLCPKQGNKIEGQVFKCSVAHLYPNIGRVPPPPPWNLNVPTWLVSVFCVCVSVSSTLRCRLILKFLSLLASFCSTSCWCADSLEERVTRSVLEYRVHCFLRVIFVEHKLIQMESQIF